jgi:hypothetical protein
MQDCRLQVLKINQDNYLKLKDQGLIEKLKMFLFRRMTFNKLLKVWKKNKYKL